jgi:hypothetical protein
MAAHSSRVFVANFSVSISRIFGQFAWSPWAGRSASPRVCFSVS